MVPIALRNYLDPDGRNPFERWLSSLDDIALDRVTRALRRLSFGNTSNVKSVGGGISELRIDFGPGYRVYFGWGGQVLIILLGGGSKKRQQMDIATAQRRWLDYKRRKGD
jgi:putative addiction module killer protein